MSSLMDKLKNFVGVDPITGVPPIRLGGGWDGRFSKRPGPGKSLSAHWRFLRRARSFATRSRYPMSPLLPPNVGTNRDPRFVSKSPIAWQNSRGRLVRWIAGGRVVSPTAADMARAQRRATYLDAQGGR